MGSEGYEQVMGADRVFFHCSIVTFASSCDKRWSTQWLFLAISEVTVHVFVFSVLDGGKHLYSLKIAFLLLRFIAYDHVSSYRRKSRSISPRGHRSPSTTPRRRRSRTPSAKRYRRHRSRSSSLSPTRKSSSPSLGSVEHKSATEKLKKEEEKKR